jgi:EAL domain-containing protein (putative c-di-GMP-specific phosphodiesterase class I)
VDDAGAGFASLRHILRLRPDFIKLDTSLTRDIDLDVARRALARGLTSFGTEIGSTIIGEGVEKESELKTLSELGVTTAQGYYLGAPRPAAETSPTIETLKECRPQI